MKFIVAVASRHGSTFEIAEVIAGELREAGHVADLFEANYAPSVKEYDAAIIGSAVYIGRWLSEAREFIDHNQNRLKNMPVYLFSSGPLEEAPRDNTPTPFNEEELMTITNARNHQVFIGKLDKNKLGLGERMVVRMVKAPEGDFRDWQAIREWAREIASDLVPIR
jgi:menaquinone-dependent protoporphyrinogen oxidase